MSWTEERENPEALCWHFSHHYSLISMVVVASGEGVKIRWALLVPKAGTSVPYRESDLALLVLGFESRLVVMSDDSMGFVYSPSMSSHYGVENMDS